MKKNVGLMIATILVIAIVIGSVGVAVFAGVVAYMSGDITEVTETEQAQGNGSGNNVENLGGANNGTGAESGNGNEGQGGNGGENATSGVETTIQEEYVNTEVVTGFPEVPEEE